MRYRKSAAIVLTVAASLGVLALGASAAFAQENAPPLDVSTCQACHQDNAFTNAFTRSQHAGVAQSCAACHAGAAEHAAAQSEGRTDAPTPSVKNLSAKEINTNCLSCHEDTHPTWKGSSHDRREVSCASCHSVHAFKSPKAQLKTVMEPDTCYTCHTAIRAQSLRTSHHPVREGLMSCSSCHNPHDGSRPKMIKADANNELCWKCHAEKRGPFFWEHAPVRENCMSCHNPHGSNHDKLLVSQQPWLCQRCHLNTRHPGTLYTGINATGTAATASNRAVEHACKNCHQNVHGGNAPTAPYLGR
jgi:DmsE family decaheme c-type cytochrome